jgi:hypothetical protein
VKGHRLRLRARSAGAALSGAQGPAPDGVTPGQAWTAGLGNRKDYQLKHIEAALDRWPISV